MNCEICYKYIECYKLADKALFYELYMEEMKNYIESYKQFRTFFQDVFLKKYGSTVVQVPSKESTQSKHIPLFITSHERFLSKEKKLFNLLKYISKA